MKSANCPRQRLHSDFGNAPRKEDNEEPSYDTETEIQTTGYLTMVSGNLQVSLSICQHSHRSVGAVHQSWVKELGPAGVVRPVKVSPFAVLVVRKGTFHAGLVWTDASTVHMSAADTIRDHVHLVKKKYILQMAFATF